MTEYEISFLISEYVNRQWGVMQFWASVSFGLMAVSHISAKHLNMMMVVVISILYVMFSLFVLNILKMSGAVVGGYIADLQALATTESLRTLGADMVIKTRPNSGQMMVIMFTYFGTFSTSLLFLWGAFFLAKRENKDGNMNGT